MAQTLYDSFSGIARSNSGTVIAGAEVWLLDAVEQDPSDILNTPAVMYSDREGLNVITQPLISNTDGSFEFFADAGYYHVAAVNGPDVFYVANTAIGTAQALDEEDINAGGGELVGEVKMFAGPVPAGWEVLSPVSDELATAGDVFTLEDDLDGVPHWRYASRRNAIDDQVYSLLSSSDGMYKLDVDATDYLAAPAVLTTNMGFSSGGQVFDFTDDGLFAVVVGGGSNAADYGRCNLINLSTGTYTIKSPPVADINNSSGTLFSSICNVGSDKFLVTTTDPLYSSNMQLYDLALNSWSDAADRPGGVTSGHTLLLSTGKVLVYYGVTTGGAQSQQVDLYDPVLDSWQTVGQVPLGPWLGSINDFGPGFETATGGVYLPVVGGIIVYDVSSSVMSYIPAIDPAHGIFDGGATFTVPDLSLGYIYTTASMGGKTSGVALRYYADFSTYNAGQAYYARKL